jgi:two-component system NtrC family response regulator
VGLGAYDFYQKPVEMNTLALVLQRAYRIFDLERENRQLIEQECCSPLAGVIAASDCMLQVSRRIEKVAPTDATVLLLGESGTGKELLAKAIHRLSPYANNRFVPINCAAIPETLLESELFGYEKGAFTGAAKRTPGKIEYADGGTLFLDEIGDLSLALQAKLLRFLQERVIERIGGREEIPIDARIVCATHQDLQKLMENGAFRQDLYYRISAVTIKIPPLRERRDDVIRLARYFLRRYATELGCPLKGFSEDAIRALETHPWQGNVRELENKIKGAVIMTDGARISAQDLGLEIAQEEPINFNLREARKLTELGAIERALIHTAGNISKTSRLLGVSRPTLYDLLQKYHITLPE